MLHPQLVAFRRAGDMSRVRGCIRWAIPALCRLAPENRRPDIVRLDSGTAARAMVFDPFTDQAVADAVAPLRGMLGDARYDAAYRDGTTLTDPGTYELALDLIDSALAANG